MLKLSNLILLIAALLFTGCATSTPIYTRPAGADVTLEDGRELGQTPIILREQTWIWTKHTLTFTKSGYKPETIQLKASAEPVNLALCFVGSCVMWMLWPIALLGNYRVEEIVVRLEPNEEYEGLEDFSSTDTPTQDLTRGPMISWRARPR